MNQLAVYRQEPPRNLIQIVDFSRFLLSLLFLITVWLLYSLFDEDCLFDDDELRKVYIYSITSRMLYIQADEPKDYVLSTNEFHSVREFIEKAFLLKGFKIKWKGKGLNEIGYDDNTGKELIFVSNKYFRPAEVDELLGNSTKSRNELGWTPKYSFDDLVKEMVEYDCL